MQRHPTAAALTTQRRLIAQGRVKAELEDTEMGSMWIASAEAHLLPVGIGDTRADADADLKEILA